MDPLSHSIVKGTNSTSVAEAVVVEGSCDICGKVFKGKRGLTVHMNKSKCKVAKMCSELSEVQVQIEEIDEKLFPLCSVCHRSFKSTLGLRHHQARSMCADVLSLREVDPEPAHNSHFSQEYGRSLPSQDVHHSTKARHDYVAEKERLEGLRSRKNIEWPRMADNSRWQQLDKLVFGQLPEKASAEKRLAQLDVVLYEEALNLFGARKYKNVSHSFSSRRQVKIKEVRGKINQVGKKMKAAVNEEEELGFLCILDELKEERKKLVKAEHSRKRRWKRKHCRGKFYRDPFGVAREVLEPKEKSVPLDVSKEVLDQYVEEVSKDDLRDVDLTPLEGLNDILMPEFPFQKGQFPRSLFDQLLKRKRNKSSPGPNKIPYKVYKKCPNLATYLYGVFRSFLSNKRCKVPLCWRTSDGIFIAKKDKADGNNINHYRQIALMNVEGKLWWSLVSHRFYDYLVTKNKFIDVSVQKGSIRQTPGCVEHTAMVWTALKDARKYDKSIVALWLDLANAYGSVPHKLIIFALRRYGVPQEWINLITDYYWGLWGRSSCKSAKSAWFQYQRGIFAGCTISVILFLVAFNIFLEYIKLGNPDPYILNSGNILEMFRAFMDDLSILSASILGGGESLRRTKEVLEWGRMGLRADKSRSLVLNKGKPVDLEPFVVDGEQIPCLQREPLKTLGRVYDVKLDDAESRKDLRSLAVQRIHNLDRSWLSGFQKVWALHHVLVAQLQWQLMMYEISLTWVEGLERVFSKFIRKWLGVSKSLTDVALYSKRTPCPFSLESLVTTFKKTKVNVFLQLRESKDEQVKNSFREVKTGFKWSASAAVAEVTQRVQHKQLVGSLACGKAGLGYGKKYKKANEGRKELVEELKLESDEKFYLKAVQQPLQGQWVAWKDFVQKDLSWRTMLSTKPHLLRFSISATYNTLASESNKLRWGFAEDAICPLCKDEGLSCNIQHVLSGCKFSLSNGRYRFRHDQVLKTLAHGVLEYIQAGKKKKVRDSIKFIREGSKPPRNTQQSYDRIGILDSASDWTMLVDLKKSLKFPEVICSTSKRPDIVVYSGLTNQVVMIELTCPCEERFLESHQGKLLRYADLLADCVSAGWRPHLYAVEVGARGYASESLQRCLRILGLNEQRVKRCVKEASEAALRSSFWIWIKREDTSWDSQDQSSTKAKKAVPTRVKRGTSTAVKTNVKPPEAKASPVPVSASNLVRRRSLPTKKTMVKSSQAVIIPAHPPTSAEGVSTNLMPTCGLINFGNVCYMIAVIQCLFPLWGRATAPKNKLCELLWAVFSKMKIQSEAFLIVDFWDEFTSKVRDFRPLQAHDAAEFLQVFFEQIKGTMARQSFVGVCSVQRTCSVCPSKVERDPIFTVLSIPLCTRVCSIQDLIQAFSRSKSGIERRCSCGASTSTEKHTISVLPSILCISLNRFDMVQGVPKKLVTKVSNPLSEVTIQGISYSIRSVIIHSGSQHSGHYVSLVLHQSNWWMCNDDAIYTISSDRASKVAEDGYIFVFRRV